MFLMCVAFTVKHGKSAFVIQIYGLQQAATR
jgi:hypothetical protein